ncbi:MAG: DUF456 family protein [Anaerolineales bacterium]|nr:DUF456 family protein [Anaerolineales bacterium]
MSEFTEVLMRFFQIGLPFLLMLVGLFGLIIPVFPGGVIIWIGALLYGIAAGFSTWGWVFFIIITLLMIACSLVDNVLMGKEALRSGASWWSLFWAATAGVLGTLLLPPFGGLIGAPLGLAVSEWWRHRDWSRALKTTRGLAVGWGWSFLARFGIGVIMIVVWGLWVWSNAGL